jgi:Fe-S cluster assembly protein SufD
MSEIIQESKLAHFIKGLNPSSLNLSADLRQRAMNVLNTCDFPTSRHEAWKYTRVGRIAALELEQKPITISELPHSFVVDKQGLNVVFVNGVFSPVLSSNNFPVGLTIKPLSSCSGEELSRIGSNLELECEVFHALNTAFATDGMLLKIEEKAVIESTIQFIHIITGESAISNTRNAIYCGQFAEAKITMSFFSSNAHNSFTNVISEFFVGTNAKLSVDKIQYESQGNFHISTEQVAQEKDSQFTINTLTLDGTLIRNNLNIAVDGVNCVTNLNGAYILNENQHVDNHTLVDQKAPHCESNELYKGVLYDKATAVFNGRVFVRKDAQKINAFQSNGNVLLSDDATVYSKPELEIYADDVKCSHGSTTGQLDEEAVFYLRARGLSEKSARNLMVSAFIGNVLDTIENESVNNFTNAILKERFGWEF